MASSPRVRRSLWIALLPLGVAFVLRVAGLGGASLWYDEGYTVMFAREDPATQFREAARRELNTPLHYIMLGAWMAGAGQSEFAARLLSAYAGVLTVAAAYRLIRRPGSFRADWQPAAWSAAWLAALWPACVYLSREARMYGLLACLCTLSAACLADAMRASRRPAPRMWAAWAACAGAAFATHMLAAFVILPQLAVLGVWWLARRREGAAPRSPWVAAGVVCALVAGWLLYLAGFSAAYGTTYTDRLDVGVMALKSVLALAMPRLPPDDRLAWPAAAAVGGLAFAALAAPPRGRLALFIAGAAALGVAALASATGKFAPRYPEAAAPLAAAGAGSALAAGLAAWPRLRAGRAMAGAAASVAAIAIASAWCAQATVAMAGDPSLPSEDFRSAAAFLRARVQPDEIVLLVSGHFAPVFAYYYGPAGWSAIPDDPVLDIARTLHYRTAAPALNAALEGKRGAWLLLWQDQVIDPSGIVQTLLIQQAGGADFDTREFHGLRLLHYTFHPYRATAEAPPGADSAIERAGLARGLDSAGCSAFAPLNPGAPRLGVLCHWLLRPPPPANILPYDAGVSLSLIGPGGDEVSRHEGLLAPVNGLPARWGMDPITALYWLSLPDSLPAGEYRLLVEPSLGGQPISPRVSVSVGLPVE